MVWGFGLGFTARCRGTSVPIEGPSSLEDGVLGCIVLYETRNLRNP